MFKLSFVGRNMENGMKTKARQTSQSKKESTQREKVKFAKKKSLFTPTPKIGHTSRVGQKTQMEVIADRILRSLVFPIPIIN